MTRVVGTPITAVEFANLGDEAFSAKLTGDSVTRVRIDAGGRITWSSGASTGDVTLYRNGANILRTDDTFDAVGGIITLTSDGEPTENLADGALAIDTSNNTLYFRSGSVWRTVATGASSIDLDGLTDVVITSEAAGEILVFDGTNWVNGTAPSGEPIGFPNRTDSLMTFNNVDRIFQIEPTSSSFEVWCTGRKYTKSSAQQVVIPNTTGLYYIYFDSTGTLQYKTTYFTWDQDTPVAYVYWNATLGAAQFFADERHGIALDWATHEYLHRTRGAAIANGFGASAYTLDGDGSSDADAQIDIADGTFFDEDLQIDISHSATPTPNTWEQVLQGAAEIPVFYKSGNVWVKDAATPFPLKQGTDRPTYNLNTGGVWSTPDIANSQCTISWIIATNNLNEPIIAILGQDSYTDSQAAHAEFYENLDLDGFPIVEFRPLYKLIFEGRTTWTNTPSARLNGITDLRSIISGGFGIPTVPVSDHGNLTGLTDDDHTQYLTDDRHNLLDHSTIADTINLGELGNVVLTEAPSVDDVLVWDGSDWTNDAMSTRTFESVSLTTDPTSSNHAVRKSYVDALAAGINWHDAVYLATAASLGQAPYYDNGTSGVGATLTATGNARLSVDGTNATNGDRVLVKNQATAQENGIYVVTDQGSSTSTWLLTRASDFNASISGQIKSGEAVFVKNGTTNANQGFILTSAGTGTGGSHILSTDILTFTQFTGTATFTAGNGLTKTGNTLDVVSADAGRIVVNADSVDLAVVGQSNTTGSAAYSFVSAVTVDSYGRVTGVQTSDVGITLGTHTSGDYVESLVAGDGITLSNNSGEGATPTIALTTDSFTLGSTVISLSDIVASVTGLTSVTADNFYGDLTGDVSAGTVSATSFIGDLSGNASTADTWSSSITITLGTALSGSVSFDGSGNATLDASIVNNAITLGTHTSGDYVASITAGTGVSIGTGTGEGSTPLISIGQAVGTTADVMFNTVAASAGLTTNTTAGTPTGTPPAGRLTVDTTNGLLYFYTGSAWQSVRVGPSTIGLGTETSGDYVQTLTAGTGVTITGASGAYSNPTIAIGQAVGTTDNVTFNDVIVSGDLTVNGTTTTINATTLTVDDKNIELGSTASPSDASADGGGITLKGTSDKTFSWVDATDSWTSSENLDLASGKSLKINGSNVLTATSLSNSVAISGSTIALDTIESSSLGRISWDSSNYKLKVGDGTNVQEFVPSTVLFNPRTASYTLALTDKDKIVEVSVASANTLTIPPNSSVAFPVGTQITILQTGAGQTTLTAGAGVTVNGTPGLKLRAQWSSATLIKRSTDVWVAVGDLSA
jgi:hypothetical protein